MISAQSVGDHWGELMHTEEHYSEVLTHMCQRYAAMGLRFLASNPEVRVYIVKEGMVAPFLALAESPLLVTKRLPVESKLWQRKCALRGARARARRAPGSAAP